MATYRADALDAKLTDLRGAACVGFLAHIFFFPQPPRFIASKSDQPLQQATGSIVGGRGEASEENLRIAAVGQRRA